MDHTRLAEFLGQATARGELRPCNPTAAAEAGMSMTTMAVAWVLSHPAITSAIIGASRPEQLADSLAAAETGVFVRRPQGQARRIDPPVARGRRRPLAG
ncbi:MAG: aldo/keto reductase [Phenylobacterium sp.]|uniref:aldo/keto reductase n=1 Tax=Phenylobacterium sp. TaxID=1871053 RepID=UPI002732EB14|nr:aldo/keto reductase [Phenylobacterium sp.]MDP3174254.1 aldo/keto reductase [Phenylobacterium sp.]